MQFIFFIVIFSLKENKNIMQVKNIFHKSSIQFFLNTFLQT